MSNDSDLKTLERKAYAAAYSDGIFDLYFGLSLVWIGAAWLWLPDFSGLAGVLPAVFLVPVMELRKRVVTSRFGYVKWSDVRQARERNSLIQMLVLGVLMLAVGIGLFHVQDSADTSFVESIVPALPAFLLGLAAFALGILSGLWRAIGYGVVLVGAGVATLWQEGDPGMDMFVSGIVITLVAIVTMILFFTQNPQIEGQ